MVKSALWNGCLTALNIACWRGVAHDQSAWSLNCCHTRNSSLCSFDECSNHCCCCQWKTPSKKLGQWMHFMAWCDRRSASKVEITSSRDHGVMIWIFDDVLFALECPYETYPRNTETDIDCNTLHQVFSFSGKLAFLARTQRCWGSIPSNTRDSIFYIIYLWQYRNTGLSMASPMESLEVQIYCPALAMPLVLEVSRSSSQKASF